VDQDPDLTNLLTTKEWAAWPWGISKAATRLLCDPLIHFTVIAPIFVLCFNVAWPHRVTHHSPMQRLVYVLAKTASVPFVYMMFLLPIQPPRVFVVVSEAQAVSAAAVMPCCKQCADRNAAMSLIACAHPLSNVIAKSTQAGVQAAYSYMQGHAMFAVRARVCSLANTTLYTYYMTHICVVFLLMVLPMQTEFCAAYLATMYAMFLFTVQHVFEGVYRVPRAEYNRAAANLIGASYLPVPWWWEWATCGVEFHHIHHMNPRVPCFRMKVRLST